MKTQTQNTNRRQNLRHQRGMTLIEIMIVIIIMAMIATGVSLGVMRQLDKAKVKDARMGACTIANAARLYIAEYNQCPTIEQVKEELNKDARTKDPWDRDYVIECQGRDPIVYSQGVEGNERLTCIGDDKD
jgi:general secretion pathway protein G